MQTFLNVLKAANIEPPIHVLYFLSGGAKILILMSLTANFLISFNNLVPKSLLNKNKNKKQKEVYFHI